VALPRYLSDQGIAQIIPPLAARTGQLWAYLGAFTVILYPFVEGRNGYEAAMSDQHWRDFGTALKRIHTLAVPPALTQRIQRETYPAQGRDTIRAFLAQLEDIALGDPVAIQLAAFLKDKRDATLDLVERAGRLAQMLHMHTPDYIVCHSDIHAGNILIDANGQFYIVDWDNPILAPKERDLMFVGGGQGFIGHTAQEEDFLFYQGYGQTQIDQIALAYYRYERIVQDIAIYSEQLFLTTEGGEDREQSLYYLMSNFWPDGTIAVAYRSDKTELWA
jgi:spectinomycin phosphotransferase